MDDGWVIDLARGGTYAKACKGGFVPALVTQLKLFDYRMGRLYGGAELLAVQGFNPSLLALQATSYRTCNFLAGCQAFVNLSRAGVTNRRYVLESALSKRSAPIHPKSKRAQ